MVLHKDRDVVVEEQEVITVDEVVVEVSRVVQWVREEYQRKIDEIRDSDRFGTSYSSLHAELYIPFCASAFPD